MMRWISLCAGILLLVVLVACTSAPQPTTQTTKPPLSTPKTTPAPVPETTLTNAPAEPVSVTADGRLSFVDHRSLTFGTSGKVGQVTVSELDRVIKGQVLAKLDITSLERAVKTAELALSSSEVDLKQAEYGVRTAEIDLEQASDNLRKISYPYTYSTFIFDAPAALQYISEVEREIMDIKKTLQAGLTTAQYYEISAHLNDAEENLNLARERLARGTGENVFEEHLLAIKDFWTLRAAQLQRDKSQAALDNARNSASKAKLAVDKAKYEVDTAKDMLDKAIITAPFDGVIAKVNVKEGDVLSSGNYATTIAIEIVAPSRMELNVKVNELDIPNVKLGQKVTISVDALPDEQFESVVTSISSLPIVEAGMVSYEVKIVFDVPVNSALKAGMGATADIIVDKRS